MVTSQCVVCSSRCYNNHSSREYLNQKSFQSCLAVVGISVYNSTHICCLHSFDPTRQYTTSFLVRVGSSISYHITYCCCWLCCCCYDTNKQTIIAASRAKGESKAEQRNFFNEVHVEKMTLRFNDIYSHHITISSHMMWCVAVVMLLLLLSLLLCTTRVILDCGALTWRVVSRVLLA